VVQNTVEAQGGGGGPPHRDTLSPDLLAQLHTLQAERAQPNQQPTDRYKGLALTNAEKQGMHQTDPIEQNRYDVTYGHAIRSKLFTITTPINPHTDIHPTGKN
jgi:hypothetical protein